VKSPSRRLGRWENLLLPEGGGREGCVSDEPELFERVIAVCRQYYERKWQKEKAVDKSSDREE